MINLIAGLNGSGKSTYLGRKVTEALNAGDTVYTFYKFRFKDPRVKYFHKIDEIIDMQNCLIVLDEAQLWFNSRSWDTLNVDLQYALQLHRHQGVDLWGAVQHANRVDTVFRELVHNYFEIKRIAGTQPKRIKGKTYLPKRPWQLSWIRPYDIMRANNVTRSAGHYGMGRPLFFTKKDFEVFDSFADWREDTTKSDFIKEEVEVWTCKTCGHKSYKNPHR